MVKLFHALACLAAAGTAVEAAADVVAPNKNSNSNNDGKSIVDDGDNITKVYIVFSNHFDAGYTMNENGSCAGAVVNQYFHEHFPKAITTGREARAAGRFQYRWMTQAWLVNAFRHCEDTKINIDGPEAPSDIVCPNASALADFEGAVRAGDIGWHAFPFNAEPETFNSIQLLNAAFNLTFAEDAHFGHARRQTLSQRDVPGLTRALIPHLARHNVTAVSVGENSQVAPLNVPSLFNWVDTASNTSVISLFHALGYGRRLRSRRSLRGVASHEGSGHRSSSSSSSSSSSAESLEADECVVTAEGPSCADDEDVVYYTDRSGQRIFKESADPYDDGPGMHVDTLGDGTTVVTASRSSHCVEVQVAGTAICYAWRVDNTGPHAYDEASIILDAVEVLFPNAQPKAEKGRGVVASDAFDDFIADIQPYVDTLPVVTAELGDTWIMGANSDPYKVALFRAASRAYDQCMLSGGEAACLGASPTAADVAALRSFERLLMVVTEHTWGWNGGRVRHKGWSNDALQEALKTDDQFQSSVGTWKEARAFVPNAVAALPKGCPLASSIEKAFSEIWRANSDGGSAPLRLNHGHGWQAELSAAALSFDIVNHSHHGHHHQHPSAHLHGAESAASGPLVSVHEPGDLMECGAFQMAFGDDGAIVNLATSNGSHVWADDAHPLARVWYHGMGLPYFRNYLDQYIAGPSAIDPELTAENYYKPNLQLPGLSANATVSKIVRFVDRGGNGHGAMNGNSSIVIDLAFPNEVHTERGAPASMAVLIECGSGDAADVDHTSWSMNYNLRWVNKTATHVPETIWLSSISSLLDASSAAKATVAVNKLDYDIDATEADLGCDGSDRRTCGVHLHGVSDLGVTITSTVGEKQHKLAARQGLKSSTQSINVVSLDSQLVSIGTADPAPTPLRKPDITGGVHMALVGNIWNTNYPFWYPFVEEDASAQYRFKFSFSVSE